jgi:hypothetical protein
VKSFLLAALLVACCFGGYAQDSEPRVRRYVTRALKTTNETAPAASAPATIPFWSGTTSGYTYQMVGQDPTQTLSNPTTNLTTPVIPVILTFSDGTVFDPTVADGTCSKPGIPLSLMLASPLFNDNTWAPGGTAVGTTQYHDFFQRANFWQYTKPGGVNPNYHILLNASSGTPLKVTVPADSGKTAAGQCGRMGEMEIDWFDNYLETTGFKQLASNGVTLASLPVFMLYNVVMYDSTVASCCILGYHSAFNNPNYSNGVQAYAVGDFDTSGGFGPTLDVSSFSHEIAELIDDPTGNNPTPPWGNVGQVAGCQSNLEVGDPLSGTDITVTASNNYVYHLQELAFLSWFFGTTPSIGVNGWYSSNDTFKTPAALCATTTTSLSISPTMLVAGGSAAVKIAVAPTGHSPSTAGTPTGTVNLVSNAGTKLDSFTLAAGAVNASVTNLPSGNYSVTAQYQGDGTFSPSTSAPVILNVGTGTVVFSPVALTFDAEPVGTASASQSVTLTNKGTAALANIAISIAGASPGDFSQTNNCGASLAVNASCSIAVVFKPTASGLRTALVGVADNAAGSPQTVPLAGTGAGTTGKPTLGLSPTSLSFGNENLGSTSASQTITVSNTGTAALTILIVGVTGPDAGDFSFTTTCGHSLDASATCMVAVSFRPRAAGSRTASVSFADFTATPLESVALSGTGVSTGTPTVTLSPTALAFGNEPEFSQSAAQTVKITNSGTGPLSITSLTIAGTNRQDFSGTSSCPSLLAMNASCSVSLRFRPGALGALTATLSIADNAANSPQSVVLTGTGVAPVSGHEH